MVLDRAKAVNILKEVCASGGIPPLINLRRLSSDSLELELEIKPATFALSRLKGIAESHNLKYRESNGKAIMF